MLLGLPELDSLDQWSYSIRGTLEQDLGFMEVYKRKRNTYLKKGISIINTTFTGPLEGRPTSLRIALNKSLAFISHIPTNTNVIILIKSRNNFLIFNNPKRNYNFFFFFFKWILIWKVYYWRLSHVLGHGLSYQFEICDLSKLEVNLQ